MNRNLFFILFFFAVNSYGQNMGKLGFKWRKPEPFVTIPDSLKNEDAVAIYNIRGVKNEFDITNTLNYRTSYYIKRKIRILTARGLNEYTNIFVRKRGSQTVSTLDARTIKKDGKTIQIKPDDIKLLKTYDDEKDIYYDEYRIAIPGVEVGDEIEYIYTSYADGLSWADDIYLYTDIACMESSFELTLSRGLITDAFGINGMPPPVTTNEERTQKLTWTLNMLPSIKNQNFAIQDKEFPYIQYRVSKLLLPAYNIDKEISISEWGQLYDVLARNMCDHNSKSRGLESYFSGFKSTLDTMNSFDKVKFFVNKINNDFTLLADEDKENQLRPVRFFIDNKKIDETNLMLYYKYMFYFLHIPYETCFGKSRYAGDLFPEIVSSHQITHVFYSFSDEQQLKHFLFISNDEIKYSPDERPFALEETNVIYLKKDDPFSNAKPVVQFKPLQRISPGNNLRLVTCSYTLGQDWSDAICDTKLTFTGMPSLRYRGSWLGQLESYKKEELIKYLDEKENKSFTLDTVYLEQSEHEAPFKTGFRIRTREKDVVTTTSENIHLLKVEIPLGHRTIKTFSAPRITDLYSPYLFNDEITYYVQFPAGVSVINVQELNKNLTNDAGNFFMTIDKINDTLYKVSSVYKIKASKLPKEKYKMLIDLNDLVDQTRELNLLYKKL